MKIKINPEDLINLNQRFLCLDWSFKGFNNCEIPAAIEEYYIDLKNEYKKFLTFLEIDNNESGSD